jgi:hypothetical protein
LQKCIFSPAFRDKQTIHGQKDALSQKFCISRYKMPEKDALSQHFPFHMISCLKKLRSESISSWIDIEYLNLLDQPAVGIMKLILSNMISNYNWHYEMDYFATFTFFNRRTRDASQGHST